MILQEEDLDTLVSVSVREEKQDGVVRIAGLGNNGIDIIGTTFYCPSVPRVEPSYTRWVDIRMERGQEGLVALNICQDFSNNDQKRHRKHSHILRGYWRSVSKFPMLDLHTQWEPIDRERLACIINGELVTEVYGRVFTTAPFAIDGRVFLSGHLILQYLEGLMTKDELCIVANKSIPEQGMIAELAKLNHALSWSYKNGNTLAQKLADFEEVVADSLRAREEVLRFNRELSGLYESSLTLNALLREQLRSSQEESDAVSVTLTALERVHEQTEKKLEQEKLEALSWRAIAGNLDWALTHHPWLPPVWNSEVGYAREEYRRKKILSNELSK